MKRIAAALALAAVLFPFMPVAAGAFEGKRNLICVPREVLSCDPDLRCTKTRIQERNVPEIVAINFADQKIRLRYGIDREKFVGFGHFANEERVMVIHAVDGSDGLWSIVIQKDDGSMYVLGIEFKHGYILSGTCTRP